MQWQTQSVCIRYGIAENLDMYGANNKKESPHL